MRGFWISNSCARNSKHVIPAQAGIREPKQLLLVLHLRGNDMFIAHLDIFLNICYINIMHSKILQQDQDDLIRISKSMTPEERLEAFYNHSQLMTQVYLAGSKFRNQASRSNK